MLTNRSRWCVVTHHKENYSLFPAFTAFYRKYYGIQRMLIYCGLTRGRTHDSLKQFLAAKLKVPVPANDRILRTPNQRELTISEFAVGDFILWAASYPTGEFTPDSDLHKLKLDLNAWGESFLPKEISRTLVVDCDEFLYVKDPHILDSLDNLGFHFLDVVPSPVWPPRELKFSLQGWYYRRQARPTFKYGKWIALPLARLTGRGLQHGGCKTYYFDRKRMGTLTAWHHGTITSLSCCFALNQHLHQTKLCREILQNTACCYHLANPYKEFFLTERLRLSTRLQTDLKKGSDQDEQRGPETEDLQLAGETFDRQIKKSIFPVIEDNFLLTYLQEQ
jgi:hypothetical protein